MSHQKVNKIQYWLNHVSKHFTSGTKYVNPCRVTCPSGFAMDAIEELGLDQWHRLDTVRCKTKDIMKSVSYDEDLSQWDAFYINTPKKITAEERLHNIIKYLPYYYKEHLQSVGCCLQKRKCKGDIYLRLHTQSTMKVTQDPVTPNKKRSIFSRLTGVLRMITGMFRS